MFKKIKYKYLLYFLVFFSISSCSDIIHDNQKTQETKLIKLSTNMGDITLELFQDKAPETVANFLKYTNEGKLNGTIEVDELLTLKSTAKLQGEISTNKLAIEPGAIFSGNCKMGAVLKDLSSNEESINQNKESLKDKTA